MLQDWKHVSTIRCPILFISEDTDIDLVIESAHISRLRIAKPKKIETAPRTGWDRILQPIYEYTVTAYFKADKDNAVSLAQASIENIASRLSLFCSAPVLIESYGSVTNAPDNPQPGVTYVSEIFASNQASISPNARTIPKEAMNRLLQFLVQDELLKEGNQTLERSIRWLCHSYFTASPLEEFMCLMLSFEGISGLIMPSKARYWQCNRCGHETTECPACHASTQWPGSGNTNMMTFVTEKLSWKRETWRDTWTLRNQLFHGSQDITAEQQQVIAGLLQPLEQAVISAIGYLLSGKKNVPRVPGRPRAMFTAAVLHVEHQVPP